MVTRGEVRTKAEVTEMMMVMRRMVAHRALTTTQHNTTQRQHGDVQDKTARHGTEGQPRSCALENYCTARSCTEHTVTTAGDKKKASRRGGQTPTAHKHHAPALRQGHSLGLAQEETEGAVNGPGLVHALDDDEHGRDGHDRVGGEAVKGWRNVATGRGGSGDGENEEVG